MSQVKSLRTDIKFKNTPIGKIPVDWEVVNLSQVTEINMGQSPESQDCHDHEDGLPFYQGNADFGPKYPTTRRWCKKPLKIAQTGDILISVRAPVGEINIASHKCCIGRGLGAIHAVKINSEYLYQSMLFHRKALEKVSQGSTFEAINRKDLAAFLIFAAPISEQKKIAEILTTVDDAIEETDGIIEKTKELKKGVMQRLLTRGIGHRKFKKTEIGVIPEEWEVGEISDFGDIVTGSTPSTVVKEYYGNEVPFVSPFDLGKIKVIRQTEKYLSKEGSAVARMLPVNTVLFVCIGSTIGKIGIAGAKLAANQQINSIVCRNSDFNFVYYYLSFISDKIKQMAGTQAVPIVNKSLFSNVAVAIPEQKEQKEIGSILSSVDEDVEEAELYKQYLGSLKQSLMQVLLTGKVRVKLH